MLVVPIVRHLLIVLAELRVFLPGLAIRLSAVLCASDSDGSG
jgi:hypothetical protein